MTEDYAPLPAKDFRGFELLLVLGFAFGDRIIQSFIAITTGTTIPDFWNSAIGILGPLTIIHQVISLLLLVYVLHRNNITLADLGLKYKKGDFAASILIFLAAVVMILAVGYALSWVGMYRFVLDPESRPLRTSQIADGLTVAMVFLVVTTPIFEQIIVLGYGMTIVKSLFTKPWICVGFGILFPMLTHYQGNAISSVVGSGVVAIFPIYYYKKNRLVPVILANTFMQFSSLYGWLMLTRR